LCTKVLVVIKKVVTQYKLSV